MYYSRRFLHRIQEDFFIVGKDDYEELSSLNTQHIRYLEISLDALHCLPLFSSVEYLILTAGQISNDDLHFLDGMKIKALKIDYYSYEYDSYSIDLSRFPNLSLVFARTERCFRNADQCRSLQTLIVQEWLSVNLDSLNGSSVKALKLLSGKLKCLDGVGQMPQLLSLSISNQRQLVDCSDLSAVSLESLEIVSCNKVEIFQLPMLANIRMLHVSGRKPIPDIQGILDIAPKLEWLLLDCIVTDGDLSPLSNLHHAVIFTDCRYYSHRNSDLPKSSEKYRSKHLPFEFEILPEAY